MQALEEGKGSKRLTSGFTTVGKPKIAQKQYNSPLEMYSEEVLEEIMTSGTVGYVFVCSFDLMHRLSRHLVQYMYTNYKVTFLCNVVVPRKYIHKNLVGKLIARFYAISFRIFELFKESIFLS